MGSYIGIDPGGPVNFGFKTGPLAGTFFPDSGGGDFLGISGADGILLVPSGYVSGNALSSTSTWLNTSFADLGVRPAPTYGRGGLGPMSTRSRSTSAQLPAPDPSRSPNLRAQCCSARRSPDWC